MINTCVQFLEETAGKCPAKTAVTDQDRALTYAELKRDALKTAFALGDIGRNRPVAVFLPKSCHSVIAFLGTLYTGNFYVPLDVKSPKERLEKILRDLGPEAVITNSSLETSIFEMTGMGAKIINLDKVLTEETLTKFDFVSRIDRVIDTDPIYCIYTSGSTGMPKGVVIPHRGVVDYVNYAIDCYQLHEDTVFGNQAQFHFDISALDLYGTLKLGATLHLLPERLFTFPVQLPEYLERKGINTIYWVPSAMNQLAQSDTLSLLKSKPLKKILFAGEVMPTKTLNYWRKYFPDAVFSNLYGPTEITITCTYYTVDRDFDDQESLPIGKACRNSDVLVLDENDQLVWQTEVGKLGELCVRGSSLALGYWGDFEKTDSAFVQNPLNSHYPEKIYRTGDYVAYNDRGELDYRGRKDQQIKYMGYRIELGEIERAVLSVSGIDNACVLYDRIRQHIVCIYESQSPGTNDAYLKKRLMHSLPKYMVPTRYVRLTRLPLSGTGKIDRVLIQSDYEKSLSGGSNA